MADEQKIEETAAENTPVATETPAEAKAEPVKVADVVPGMVVRVHQKIKETNTKGEERERVQIFEGTVIAVKGKDATSRTITVRKIASGVGVERIFPVQSTALAKIEQVKKLQANRAKLYFVRTSKKKLKEAKQKGPATTPKKTGAKK